MKETKPDSAPFNVEMHPQHFELIARVLRETNAPMLQIRRFAEALAQTSRYDFNLERFVTDCLPEDEPDPEYRFHNW